jgi:hypothetical protein
MTSDEIISRNGLLHIDEPMPEEIERAISNARRLRAETFRGAARAGAAWIARAFRGGRVQPARAAGAANPALSA